MNLPAILFLLIAVTHYGYDVACTVFSSLKGLEQQVFYVLRGIEGFVLFLVISRISSTLLLVCLWGMIEEGQTAVCQSIQIFRPRSLPGFGAGLCDQQAVFPFYMAGVLIMALIAGGMKIGRRL